MRILLLLTLLFTSGLKAQNDFERRHVAGLRFNRYDLFTQYSMQYQKANTAHEVGAGLGTIRSVFQQRLYPEVFYRFQYAFQQRSSFAWGSDAAFFSSTLEVNRQSHARHYFQEAMLGLWAEGGKRLKVRLHVESGLHVESLYSKLKQNYVHHKNLGYSGQISFSYAL